MGRRLLIISERKKISYQSYIQDVKDNKIVVGKYIKLAIDRHLKDLEREDVFFNEKKAKGAVLFFSSFFKAL